MSQDDRTAGGEPGEARERPDSTGPNARPRDGTIAQTGEGVPDDTSAPVEITPDEEARIARKIREL